MSPKVFGHHFYLGRFDLPVMSGVLLSQLSKGGKKVSILKKGVSYFCIESAGLVFKDVLKFTTPCNLSKYLRQWEVCEEKSIFPYEAFNSVEEINNQIDFPSHARFYSALKKENIDINDYNKAKQEYERRQSLEDSDPDKIVNFGGWLELYNKLDVGPLCKAIQNSFESLHKLFGEDATTHLSLPSLACSAMFRNYDPSSSLSYSFARKNEDVRKVMRANVVGGLVMYTEDTYQRKTQAYRTIYSGYQTAKTLK